MTDVFRDRIKSLRRVKACDLVANPKNWRRHPEAQRGTLSAAMGEIGLADALLVRETEKGLEIIDGHLRADICADQKVPVLVLDVTAAEADKLLATLDPLAAMAEIDLEALAALGEGIQFDSSDLDAMLAELLGSAPDFQPTSQDGQSRLDEKSPITCPHCGQEFVPP